jgi:hypothetical protein
MAQPLLGASDCERIRSGRLAQPVNALSSAVLGSIGLAVAARGRQQLDPRRSCALGAAITATGLGSFVYHGPGGRLAEWLHDATAACLVAFVPVENLRALRGVSVSGALAAYGMSCAAIALLLRVRPSVLPHLSTALLLAAATTQGRALRHRPATPAERLSAALLAAAAFSYAAGRTGSPLCRPDSRLQLHGVWHVLAGAAAAAWANGAFADTSA